MIELSLGLLWCVGIHLGVGLLFAVPFSFGGVHRVDPAARHAPITFRLLIIPGVAALWPLMLAKWIRAARAEATP